jgi:hypothetical protein
MRVTDGGETGLARRIGTIGTFDASGAGDEEGKADAGSDPIAARDSTSGGAAVADARQLTAHTPGDQRGNGDPDERCTADRRDSARAVVCGEGFGLARLRAARRAIGHGWILVTLRERNVA